MGLTNTQQLQQQNADAALSGLTLPKMPYVPPPTDPRELPKWYNKFHAEMNKWVERVNQAIRATA